MTRIGILGLLLLSSIPVKAGSPESDLDTSIKVIEKGASRKLSSAVSQLITIGKPAVPRLLIVLESSDHVANESAMLALEGIFKSKDNQTQEGMDRLIEISRGTKELPAHRAAYLLGKFSNQKALSSLQENAENEKLPVGHRLAAIKNLAVQSDKENYRPILERLKNSKDAKIKSEVLSALASMGDTGGYNEAVKLLRDSPPRSKEQRSAIATLEKIGNPRAVAELQKLVDEGKTDWRANKALAQIRFRQFKTDDERKTFLRDSFKTAGMIGDWARKEIWEQQKRNPEFRELFEEAAKDPRHPQAGASKAMLKSLEK